MADELALIGISGETHQLREGGSDDMRFVEALFRHGHVGQHTGRAV